MKESLRLYKELLRAARSFPVTPVARKLESNIREVSQAFLNENNPDKVSELREDGHAALQVIAFLKSLPKVNPSRCQTCAWRCALPIGLADQGGTASGAIAVWSALRPV